MNNSSENKIQCPFCHSNDTIMDYKRAEIICANCGLVIDDNLVDMGPEWIAFDQDQINKRARVGAPTTYTISDKGLSTTIDYRNKDFHGRNIQNDDKFQLYRLRKWNRRLKTSRTGEKNLAYGLNELNRQTSTLNLPKSTREDAAFIYRKANKKNITSGRKIESVVGSCIYIACRRFNIPRTLDEVADVSKVSKKQIGKTYRFLSKELNIKLRPTSPADYIPRFSTKLQVSNKVESKAIEIIEQAVKKGLTVGKGPAGVAAAALYISSILMREWKSQKEIADNLGVTEVTIRKIYKELIEQLDLGVTFYMF